MKTIELVYENGCPNVELARTRLRQAFTETGVPAQWVEWERGDTSSPSHVRAYGSPTVLVDKKDVSGIDPSGSAPCCRLYDAANGDVSGAPSVEMIATALRKID